MGRVGIIGNLTLHWMMEFKLIQHTAGIQVWFALIIPSWDSSCFLSIASCAMLISGEPSPRCWLSNAAQELQQRGRATVVPNTTPSTHRRVISSPVLSADRATDDSEIPRPLVPFPILSSCFCGCSFSPWRPRDMLWSNSCSLLCRWS